jgi:hypothetical protein
VLGSALATWFPGGRVSARFRRQLLTGRPALLAARDGRWRDLAPPFRDTVRLAGSGIPVQSVADRRYDRVPTSQRLARALADGHTIFLPQIHQILPRLMRLMIALRVTCFGAGGDECSFLFLVEGTDRRGMGLHHDGPVHAVWLQLEGRRTVTVGPPVRPGTPADLDDRLAQPGEALLGHGWWTGDLAPGTLLYLPPFTPHAVICRGRSLALSLTWRRPARPARDGAVAAAVRDARVARRLVRWDVASGYADRRPTDSRSRLWTQMPVVAGTPRPGGRTFTAWTPHLGGIALPATARRLVTGLATMPWLSRTAVEATGTVGRALLAHGILAPHDLPLRIVPDDPSALDGWRFA